MIKVVIFDLGNTLLREKDGSVFPHALEVLTRLKNKYRLALITNTRHDDYEKIQEILRGAHMDGFFEEVVVSKDVGISKPNPSIFEIALEKLGVNPDEAVMVGNTISTDIFGARA